MHIIKKKIYLDVSEITKIALKQHQMCKFSFKFSYIQDINGNNELIMRFL